MHPYIDQHVTNLAVELGNPGAKRVLPGMQRGAGVLTIQGHGVLIDLHVQFIGRNELKFTLFSSFSFAGLQMGLEVIMENKSLGPLFELRPTMARYVLNPFEFRAGIYLALPEKSNVIRRLQGDLTRISGVPHPNGLVCQDASLNVL